MKFPRRVSFVHFNVTRGKVEKAGKETSPHCRQLEIYPGAFRQRQRGLFSHFSRLLIYLEFQFASVPHTQKSSLNVTGRFSETVTFNNMTYDANRSSNNSVW